MIRLPFCLLSFVLALAILSPAKAGDESNKTSDTKQPEVKVISLTVHPALPPRQPLQYRLLLPLPQQISGDAIPDYARAFLLWQERKNGLSDEASRQLTKLRNDVAGSWMTGPIEKFPKKQAKDILEKFSLATECAERASRQARCDWGPPPQPNYTNVNLIEAFYFRNLARLFALRARLQIAEKNYAEACESLQVGYSMARHVAKQPFMVSTMAGASITEMMDEQLLSLCQQPDAPNLYWSIAALPRPIIDMRKSLECEYDCLYLSAPLLRKVRQLQCSPAQWKLTLRAVLMQLAPAGVSDHELDAAVKKIMAFPPEAKLALLETGYSKEEIAAMPPAQIALLSIVEVYDHLRDDIYKWGCLPYCQACDKLLEMGELEFNNKDAQGRVVMNPGSLESYFPSPYHVACMLGVSARADRRLATLMCIEALRLYAATHDGRLPKSLDEIDEAPCPINPLTGKPFGYCVEDGTAIIDADDREFNDVEYHVRLAE